MQAVIFNERLDAVVCATFLLLVTIIVLDSLRVWYSLWKGTRPAVSSEAPFVESELELTRL
jgi:carbon starvation protein